MRQVAILGMAPSWREAPWYDASWEIWQCNDAHRGGWLGPNHPSRWFQIHAVEGCNEGEVEWLRALNAGHFDVPTYVSPRAIDEWFRRFPRACSTGVIVPYPLDKVRALFPYGWLANTFCLEIALALLEGVERIGVWGVECVSYGREVTVERPAVAAWLGIASARGVDVVLPPGSTLRPYSYAYGIDYWEEARAAAELTERILPPLDFDRDNLDTIAAVDAAEERAYVSLRKNRTE